MSVVSQLTPAIVETFAIILLGFFLGQNGMVKPGVGSALGQYVGKIALPSLLFVAMATLDLDKINVAFLVGVLLSKALLFFSVIGLSTLVEKGREGTSRAAAQGAIRGIFCTQSNDLAMGIPIVNALFSKTHPEFASYLFLIAPVNLMILNPIGFLIMEHGRPLQDGEKKRSGKKIMFDVMTNPIVSMVFLGLVTNLLVGGTLPDVVSFPLRALGSSFTGTALFCLGLGMVGKVSDMRGAALLVPALLIAAKSLVLPLIQRQVVSALGGNWDIITLAFLVGTFPTAASVPLFAEQYNACVDIIGPSMVIGTFVSAPVMFISAQMAAVSGSSKSVEMDILKSDMHICIVSIVGAFLFAWGLILIRNHKMSAKAKYFFRLLIALNVVHLGYNICTQLCNVPTATDAAVQVRWFFFIFFTCAAKLYTVALAYAITQLNRPSTNYTKSFWRVSLAVVIVSAGCPIFTILVGEPRFDTGDFAECIELYGRTELDLVIAVLGVSTLLCIYFLVQIYGQTALHSTGLSASLLTAAKDSEQPQRTDSNISSEYLTFSSDSSDGDEEGTHTRTFEVDQALQFRATLFIFYTCFSMAVSFALSMWLTIDKSGDADDMSGVEIEVRYLDGALLFFQGFVVFAAFGFHPTIRRAMYRVVHRLAYWYRRTLFDVEDISAVPHSSAEEFARVQPLVEETLAQLPVLAKRLVRTRYYHLRKYEDVFVGSEFVDQLMVRGICKHRADAVHVGRKLLSDGILHHIAHEHHFHDAKYFYQFTAGRAAINTLVDFPPSKSDVHAPLLQE